LSSEERIDALSRKWLKLSAGGNLEHKLEPLASARDLLELASTLPGYRYRRALRQREQMRALLKAVFSEVDIVLVPTLPVLPPTRDAETITVGGRQLDFTLALIRYTFQKIVDVLAAA
jgi:Asp-tRNA(Asn)/Glu-tRNA(Gln) amidotransferase A subunit family amidase